MDRSLSPTNTSRIPEILMISFLRRSAPAVSMSGTTSARPATNSQKCSTSRSCVNIGSIKTSVSFAIRYSISSFIFSCRGLVLTNNFAWLSADFIAGSCSNWWWDHPVGILLEKLFQTHDRKKFSVYTYSTRNDDASEIARSIKESSDRFTDLAGYSNFEAASRIFNDRLDILVDLAVSDVSSFRVE